MKLFAFVSKLSRLDWKILVFLGTAMAVLGLGGLFVYESAVDLATLQSDRVKLVLFCGLVAGLLLLAVFGIVHNEMSRRIEAEESLTTSMRRLEDINREILDLSYMVEGIQACQNFGELREIAKRSLPQIFPGFDGAMAVVTESARSILETVLKFGSGTPLPHKFHADDCWALRRGHPYLGGVEAALHCRHVAAQDSGQSYCMPLLAQGKLVGLLSIASPAGLNERRQKLAVVVCEQLSLALANLSLREKLKNLSIVDPLTGLYNRRHLDEAFEQLSVRRMEQPFGLIMADIDHFKKFNDLHGHDAGDHVLKSISQVLQNKVRPEDTVFRFGGEELVILLPNADVDQVRERAELIRSEVERLELFHLGKPLGSVTISLGTACSPGGTIKLEEMLKKADQGLYLAKKAGRNRIATA